MVKVFRDDADTVLKNVVEAMQGKKAKNIVTLDLNKIPNSVTHYFAICSATSKTQVDAIYENVLEFVKKNCGINPSHREGVTNSEWILIDYFDVVVHIFLEDTRDFYKLEELWADADKTIHNSDN
jgi:ribosome-associated protein